MARRRVDRRFPGQPGDARWRLRPHREIIVGVVGALIGGFLASTLLKMPNAVNGINVTSIFVAFVGAVILIAILRLVSGRRRLA